ncbi:hypothetical protein J4Q44_G00233690 [Coregonus suidteri]|uniref:Centromere-associated protein E n=1 Tax=Coregonus suidteri TaxID=861788 RepID=A0AAN8L7I1_9TELE
MAEESAVKVCVRVRPLIEREETAAESAEPVKLYWKTDKQTIHQVDDGNFTKNFSFDRVFSAEETTLQLYQELAKPLVVSTVEGYNGTIFAYGQTSSGKTFTMMGSSLTPGVIPLAMEDVFQTIKNCPKKEFLLRVSYLEIYNETVTDLLCDSWKRKPLEIREGNNKNVYVADLTEELVTSPEQALAWIRKGEKNRHYGKTKMNQRSSRSHTIFRMILESRDRGDSASGENSDGAIIVSHLNLVDLAGAERASQTGAEGTRFKEGCNINRSLFTLGQVIKKLSDETQKGFTNYRDSKLTRILQNSLGGNAKTVIICTITPVTLEETLSTLQFASAAKNMKNDPHVTEVSDDGALLRRYRNEIVDLKRRLHEVSSVTQTTATEKETLSQILQEKDQLQREQEDRIKNLTKLLVTSSNFVTIKKMPKRRVTWGGKLPSPAFHHAGESDLSFAEPFLKKRKADMSVLTEQNEDGEELDSTFDMEMNQSSLTVRGFAESEFFSPNQLNKLSEKVSCLELQLENETQQKQEAMEKVETFQRRVAELETQLEEKSQMPADAQLEIEVQQNQEAMEKVATFERRVAELEKQLEEKSQMPANAQAQEAMEKVATFERRVAELETQLEEKSQMPTDAQEQMKKGFEETIQLCETLVSEKEMVATERDYLKQELNILMEQTENLKKEKAALLQEMEEKKEIDEFNSLEEESKREYEKELLNDISSLKKAMEASGRKSQELEANLLSMSEELKKKGDWAEELQRSSDIDLVQQVKQLRRSLDDAEGLSRDTKKEWAHLRSENISLKERAVTITAGYERMEAEVNGLRYQLETEKSRFKKMQVDLQRELQGAFEENTKLTTLLDGKVPKNLIDRFELEKTVADLKKELEKSHEDERTLQAKIEDLSALQDLPDKVDSLMKQVCDLTEELCAVQQEKDMLVSAKACSEEEAHQLRENVQSSQEQLVKLLDDLSKAELRENNLTQQCADITEQLETLRKDLERSSVENSQLLTTVEESSLRLKENEERRASIEDQLCGMQQVMKELEEKLADSESSKEQYDNLSQERQDQIRQLSEELIQVQAELKRQHHLNSEQQACAQQDDQHQLQIQELRAALESVTEERCQLNSDLQQNMEMAAETQGCLHSIQEELRQQRQLNSDLENQRLQKETLLEQQMKQLSDELESVQAERELLLSEKTTVPQNHAELEKLLSTVTSLTEERDQLQEILGGVREERNQLKRNLEENVEMMIENQEELRVALEKIHHQEENMKPMETANLEELQSQMKQLKEELVSVRAESERLLFEKTDSPQNHAEELEKLLSSVTSLTEERDQLQEILEGVREERNQLKRDLEENVEMQHLNSEHQPHREHQETDLRLQMQLEAVKELEEQLEAVKEERSQLKTDLQDNVEMMIENQEELRESQEKIKSLQGKIQQLKTQNADIETRLNNINGPENTSCLGELQNQIRQLNEELESVRAERVRLLSETTDSPQSHAGELKLLSTVTSLTEERDQLQEILEGVREERNQLKRDLEENVEMIIQVQTELKHQQHLNSEQQTEREHQEAQLRQQIQQLGEELETMTEERRQLKGDLQENLEMAAETQGLLHSIQEELRQQRQLNSDLESQSLQKESLLEQQAKQLSEELESVRAERERLLSEKTDSPHNHAKELEKLLSTVTSLTEERDQLQEILEGVREERNQFKRDLEENVEMSIKVQDELKHQQHLNSEQQTEREHQEAQLQQQIQQLGEELETMTEERRQLKGDLQENLEMAAETQGLLHSIQEELRQQRQLNSDLESQSLQKESLLEQQAKQLSEELESVRAERERLLSEKTDSPQNHAKELEKLLSTVTSLTEERDQLQEILEGVREERNQLKRDLKKNVEMMQQLEEECTYMRDERTQIQGDLQENMEMVIEMQRTLEQQRHLNSQQQAESEQQEAQLKQQVQHLEEQLEMVKDERSQLKSNLQYNMDMMKQLEEEFKGFKEGQSHFKVEAETSHKMLSDANATISILTEQINNLEQSTNCCTTRAGEGLCSRLEASTQQLQVSFMRFQLVINGASKPGHGPLIDVTRVEEVMILKLLPLLPKPTKKIHSNVNRSTVQITNTVWDTKVLLKLCAKDYKTHFEALVQNDLAVFEERRLQDLLLCRAQAPSHSVKVAENDFLGVWDERLSELLDRREDYLQKMNSVLKKLEESLAAHPAAVSEELSVRERSNEELSALCMVHSPDSAAVESFLERELARRSALAQANTLALQGLRDERCGLLRELGVVRAQADSQLKEERSKTSTLLQILERAPVKTEADLLRDNQQLALQRQQLDGEIKEMQMRVEQLEEDQIKAADSVSNHKQATQLLQTELQDACAKVKDREGSIQILKEKLRETEVLAKRRASPSALELEELKAKVVKMELETTASSSKHQEELLRMTTVLNHKEDALRTLKETLRRSRQEGEQSFNEGQDLHARLTTTRGRTVQSNILLEKNKLEEEVKRLQSNISELESLVSTQQGEITKWKARAIKLKEKRRDLVDKPLSPCTPTKRHLPMSSEDFLNSPKRFLDSPKKFLDSPKSKFFDVRPGSESMSINCPKQFFDNSNLGTIQEVAGIPISDMEADGSAEEDASVDKKEEWWPLSPKQADLCKQQ